jgi:hypothetical protein
MLLAFNVQAQSYLPGPWSIPNDTAAQLQSIHMRAWKLACELKRVDCKTFPPPAVAYALMDAYGKYQVGSRVVLVDLRMYGQEYGAMVLIHEMIHYIQSLQRPMVVEIDSKMACADEAEAHRLVYAFALINNLAAGDPRLKDWTPERAADYRCKYEPPR